MNRTPKVLRGCCGIGLWALLLTPTWANWQDAVPGAQIIGTGDFTLKFGSFALGGIGTATFGAIILYQLLNRGSKH